MSRYRFVLLCVCLAGALAGVCDSVEGLRLLQPDKLTEIKPLDAVDVPVMLAWHALPAAVSYSVELSTNPEFPVVGRVERSGLTATSLLLTDLQEKTTHYWRVRAVMKQGESDWSQTASFTTAAQTPTTATGKVVFCSDRDGSMQLYLVNADGIGLRRLTDDKTDKKTPRFSPDGNTIVFVSDHGIETIGADGQNRRCIIPAIKRQHPYRPFFTGDGQKIIYVMPDDEMGDTFWARQCNPDGSGVEPIRTDLMPWVRASSLGNQRGIVYYMYTMTIDMTGKFAGKDFVDGGMEPSGNLKGTLCICERWRYQADNELLLINLESRQQRVLMTIPESPAHLLLRIYPHLSPDDRFVICTMYVATGPQTGHTDIHLVSIDGTLRRSLTATAFNEFDADWGPN